MDRYISPPRSSSPPIPHPVGQPRCCSPMSRSGITRPVDPVSTSVGTLGPPFTERYTVAAVPVVCSGTVAFISEPKPAAPLPPYNQPPRPPAPPPPPLPPAPPAPPLPSRTALPPA